MGERGVMMPRRYTPVPEVNRHPALAVPCPTCEVPAGELCIGHRIVHPARFEAYYRQKHN